MTTSVSISAAGKRHDGTLLARPAFPDPEPSSSEREIVAIAPACLAGMGGRERLPALIQEEAGERTGRPGTFLLLVPRGIGRELPLHGIPCLPVDDGHVRA